MPRLRQENWFVAYVPFPAHDMQQADAEQAYIHAKLEGKEMDKGAQTCMLDDVAPFAVIVLVPENFHWRPGTWPSAPRQQQTVLAAAS